VLGGFATATVASGVFVLLEGHRSSPLLPLELFRSRTFSAANAIGLSINATYYGLIFVLSLFFQIGDGYSPIKAGLAFVPSIGTIIVANLLAPRLAARLTARRVILVSALVGGAAAAALRFAEVGSSYFSLLAQLVVLGASIGLIVPLMTSELLSTVSPSRSGVAAGTLNMSRQTGSAVGVALLGSLIGSHKHLAGGLHLSAFLAAAILVLCAVFPALMKETGVRDRETSVS
jgi:MFS transporter, DHA2 family, methylenomycin A resistance protein